jgi:hypothetical protein
MLLLPPIIAPFPLALQVHQSDQTHLGRGSQVAQEIGRALSALEAQVLTGRPQVRRASYWRRADNGVAGGSSAQKYRTSNQLDAVAHAAN